MGTTTSAQFSTAQGTYMTEDPLGLEKAREGRLGGGEKSLKKADSV